MSKKMSKKMSVSISRQFGSGGSVIGRNIAKQLDFLFLDREIVFEVANRLDASPAEVEVNDENTSGFWKSFLSTMLYADPNFVPAHVIPSDKDIFESEAEIISKIAEKKSVVVVGRGGFHILKNHINHLSIFLHANIEFRQKRVQEIFKISEGEALKLIRETDVARERHIHKFTRQNMYDLRNYNLLMDTGVAGLELTEKIIMECIRSRFLGG